MFRTRDFVLVAVVVIFLVLAFSSTLFSKNNQQSSSSSLEFSEASDSEFEASAFVPETISREERLEDIRRKIAESGEIMISAPEELVVLEEEVVSTSTEMISGALALCSDYSEYQGLWPSIGMMSSVSEGARIYYLEIVSEFEFNADMATSGVSLPPENSKQVFLQLPEQPVLSQDVNCLSSDVIGVAQDGSLIRNNEAGLYGVFGSQTLVGYALDGYPIFGKSTSDLDECGGVVVNGQYGYYLSSEKDSVLNCFSAQPVKI